jgi:hypothetical protein
MELLTIHETFLENGEFSIPDPVVDFANYVRAFVTGSGHGANIDPRLVRVGQWTKEGQQVHSQEQLDVSAQHPTLATLNLDTGDQVWVCAMLRKVLNALTMDVSGRSQPASTAS